MDESSYKILSTITYRKAGMGQKKEDIHPLRGNGLT
jgi:hypothetical protein